jgi:hypothetical protein
MNSGCFQEFEGFSPLGSFRACYPTSGSRRIAFERGDAVAQFTVAGFEARRNSRIAA